MMKLKTIEEYNQEKTQLRNFQINPGTGVQCPQCGEELVESNPNHILLTYPARKAVHCPTCKYSNSILA